jgi:hypothetical protein
MGDMNTTPTEITLNAVLTTLGHYRRLAAQTPGQYFDSPDKDVFDGSAEGYWSRVAKSLGATENDLIMD